ncbi:hypothetical protein LEMLEM_LOCUS7242, partial [Lemmus lemmus]
RTRSNKTDGRSRSWGGGGEKGGRACAPISVCACVCVHACACVRAAAQAAGVRPECGGSPRDAAARGPRLMQDTEVEAGRVALSGAPPRKLSNPGFSLLWASSPGPSGATKLPGIERLGGRALSAVRVALTKGDGPAGQASAVSPSLLSGHLETLFSRCGRFAGGGGWRGRSRRGEMLGRCRDSRAPRRSCASAPAT